MLALAPCPANIMTLGTWLWICCHNCIIKFNLEGTGLYCIALNSRVTAHCINENNGETQRLKDRGWKRQSEYMQSNIHAWLYDLAPRSFASTASKAFPFVHKTENAAAIDVLKLVGCKNGEIRLISNQLEGWSWSASSKKRVNWAI